MGNCTIKMQESPIIMNYWEFAQLNRNTGLLLLLLLGVGVGVGGGWWGRGGGAGCLGQSLMIRLLFICDFKYAWYNVV